MNQPSNEQGNIPKESAIVETPDVTTPVTQQPETDKEVQEASAELLQAITNLVQSEMQKTGDFTRETYVKAVERAKENVKQIRLIDKDQIEQHFKSLETEAEQNLKNIVEN
ncbi:MAG: hypothetical protein ACFBSC_11260 [Microcoleaceae cyanobacterium]